MKPRYASEADFLRDFTAEQLAGHPDQNETGSFVIEKKALPTRKPSALQQITDVLVRMDRRLRTLEQRLAKLEPPPTTKGVAMHYQAAAIERTS